MKTETIDTIGVWALRLLLVGGAIYCGVTGKDETAGLLAILALFSFFFL